MSKYLCRSYTSNQLGMNKYPAAGFKETIIEYDLARQSGMYVLGKQGGGKSSFLEQLVYQDICKGIRGHFDRPCV